MSLNPFGEIEVVQIHGFPFRKYGSLLQKEQEFLERQQSERTEQAISLRQLALRVATEEAIPEKSAFELVSGEIKAGDEHVYLVIKYATELEEIRKAGEDVSDTLPSVITMFIQNRVTHAFLGDNEGYLAESFGIVFDFEKGWTRQNTSGLPRHIINAIAAFFVNERDEWVAQEEMPGGTDNEIPLEWQGKSEDSKPKERKSKPTGQKSTSTSS